MVFEELEQIQRKLHCSISKVIFAVLSFGIGCCVEFKKVSLLGHVESRIMKELKYLDY